ncbi:MAG: hypothetical protein AAF492_20900, partial [Verrucomicrobiota bacterium]
MPQDLIDEANKQVEQETAIPMTRMMVSATHPHSAPSAMGCLGTRVDPDYAAWLPGKLAQCMIDAVQNLQPAQIGWATIDDWEHTHNRRWILRNDRTGNDPYGGRTVHANMHPGHRSSNVIGPSGPVDPALTLFAARTKAGTPLALFANYSQHYFGAGLLSADYFGAFCRHMARKLGEPSSEGPFVAMISQGTSGDLMWMDYGDARRGLSAETYADEVAEYAMKAWKQIQWHDHVPLAMDEKRLNVKWRVPDAERLAWARERIAALKGKRPRARPDIYAHEAVYLHEEQQTELKLQAIRIGELGIATLPNEVYAITGLKLKEQSPFPVHINVELANGAVGYIPPPEQYDLGGYTTWPARTAGLDIEAEPRIVESLLGALEAVSGQKRRPRNDQHGPYARAVLNQKPVAYWRLNGLAGTEELNAVAGGAAAKLSGKFARYLPGVGSGSGCADEEALRSSNFSGPGRINRAIHLVDSVLDIQTALPDHGSLALWYWLGEKSGAS